MEVGFGLIEGIMLGFRHFSSDEEYNFFELQIYLLVVVFTIRIYDKKEK